jgi:hypothetical protein
VLQSSKHVTAKDGGWGGGGGRGQRRGGRARLLQRRSSCYVRWMGGC